MLQPRFRWTFLNPFSGRKIGAGLIGVVTHKKKKKAFCYPNESCTLANESLQVPIKFNIFIYFSALHVSGVHVHIIRRKLLYPSDTGICHSVWVASGLLVGLG